MQNRRMLLALAIVALVAAIAVVLFRLSADPVTATVMNITVAVDTDGDVGSWLSLALDASGRPVVSYYDATNLDLKVLHCGDTNCTSGNSITSPDTVGDVGWSSSLALDSSGNPVIGYYDRTNHKMKVLRCGDPNCSSGNTITTPDPTGSGGFWTSLVLDSTDNPVVAYFTGSDLKMVHCGNPACTSGNSILVVDSFGRVGRDVSLTLDSAGNPVASYINEATGDLRVLHCGNANCTAGNSVVSPDTLGPPDFGIPSFFTTSIALDASGNPVVSYSDTFNQDLRVLHCGDPNCSAGNSITQPSNGFYPSVTLDASGNPVISHAGLAVLHCGDPNCSAGNAINSPDGFFGFWTSMALDATGNPVVGYYEFFDKDLRIVHCGDPNCVGAKPTPTPTPTVTPTPMPKNPDGDTDGDTVANSIDPDDDNDGCADVAELQPKANANTGGGRNPHDFWDFFDPNLDGAVAFADFLLVLQHFNTNDDGGAATINRNTDPLSPAAETAAGVYSPRYDRGGQTGANGWNQAPANGSIAFADFLALLVQFGHSCA